MISWVVPVSPSFGKIRAMLLTWASALKSVMESTARVTLNPSSYAPRNDRQRKPLSASYLLRLALLRQCRPPAAAQQTICSRGTAQTPHPRNKSSSAHAAPARRSR